MALNRSNLATAETPINNELGSIYSYPQWKQINSDEDLTTEQDLPQYLDYYRTELFKKGELTREKEADIQNYYVNWASNGEEVSDAEFAALANKSTAFQSGNLNDERIVNKVFPNVDFAAIDEAKQNEYLNRAKRSLMASGQLPFATILEGGRGTVEVGDFESLGTTPEKKKLASERALSAVTLGAVDPRDLWQVSEGLESTRVPNKTNFEADLDAEDLGLLREMIGDKDSPYAKIINDAIVKSIDLETYRTEGNWLQQIFADRPEEINQILADELPGEIEQITPAILDEFAKRKGWGDAQGAGLSVDNSYRFSSERISNLIKELSIVHTNNQGAFKYDEDKPENNLRITPMGVPIAHPTVMENPKAFNELLKDDRLTPSQRKALSESRRNYMYSRSYHIDDVLSSEHLESAVGDKWARAKAENPQKWKDDRVAFVDEFLSNEKNYDASKNWWGGVRASVPEAIIGIGASIGALLGNDASADYLKEAQNKQSQRRELDSLFGGEFGIGYDLATILPSVGADLASTYFLAGPLTKGAKALGVGKTLDKGVAKDVALKKIISDSALDSKKTPLAIGRFNEQTAQKFGITSSLFLTSANRSAGATYASIYNSLPEDMSHEEKHDKALGAAFARGTLTGVITSGFSALGAGGLENIVARGASFRQFKNAINKVPNVAFQANDRTTKQLLRNVIAKQAAELYKKEANSSLIKKALGSAAAEGAEEGLDEFIGSFVDSAVLNEFVPMKERINQGLYAGGLGSILGGTMTVGSETFFGPDRLIKSTNVKSEENKKVLAVDKAIDQASQALDEAGLVISSEQLKEYLKTTDTDAQATPPAVDEAVDEFGDAVDQFVGDTKEGSDVSIEESSKSIFTNFGKNFTKEDVTDYINGWAPTKIKEDIFIQYVDGKLPDNNPMRVGINAGTTDNPNIVLQVDTEKVTTALKDLKTHKQRKAALDAMLAHEFVHLSESSMLKQMWRKRSSQEEDLNFIEFSKRKLSEIYDSLVADEESKKLLIKSVAAYKGLAETEVSLPGEALTQEEISSGKSFTMEKDEIVSEFTRQFIGSNRKNKLEDIVENKDLLTHFQSLVSHVTSFLDTDTSVKDRYSSLNENVSNYLNDIEAAYIGVLEKSLGARFKEFDTKKVPNIKQEAIEEVEEDIVEETVDPQDTLWSEANKVANRKLSKRGVREETEAKAQQAKIDKVEAYLLSDPKMQESIPGFNRDILNLIKSKYESVLDSKIAKSDSKAFTFPEISDRNGENYVDGNTVRTIKELIIDSKRPDLNGVGQNSDSTDVFLTKVLLELGTNVTTETQSAETIIENNPPSKIFRVESKRVVRPLNNKQADKTSQFTEEANELLEEADIHVKNLRRNYRKGNYGTYGATELAYEEINIGLTEEGERDIKASPEEIRDFIRSGKVKKGWFSGGAADDITQGKTAEEVADYIISTTNNRAHAYLLNRIKGYLEGFVVKAPVVGDRYLRSAHPSRAKGYAAQDLLSSPEAVDIFKRNGGYSSWTPRNIYINERGLSSEIITHELVHAATEARLSAGLYDADKDSDLYKNVKELVGLVKGTVGKIPPKFKPLIDKGAKLGDFDYFSYTLNGRIVNEGRPSDTTISEFVAHGLSNVEFQNFLKSVQIEGEPDGLTKFVSFIRKVLGIPKSQNNALSELIRLTDNVLNTPKDAATMRAENGQVASWFTGPQPDPYDVYELAFPATPQRGAGKFPKEHIIQKRLEQGAKLLGSSGVPENIEEIASDWPKVMLSHTNITLGRKSRIEGNAVYDPEYPAGVMPYALKFALPKKKEVKYNAFNVRLKNVGVQLDKYKAFIDGDKFKVPEETEETEEMSVESVLNSINIQLGRKQEKVIPMNDFLLSNPSLKGMDTVPKGTIVYAQGAKEVLGGPTGDLVSYNEDIDLNQEISSGEWSAIAYNPAQGNYFYKVSGDEKNPVFEVDQKFVGAEEILMVSDLGKQPGEGANHALLVKNAKFKKLTAAQVSEESFSKKLESNLADKEAKILIKAKFTKPQKARANDLVYRLFEETTEVFDSPDLDPISVEEGFIKTNEVALVNALADYRKTRGEDISLDGYLESEFAIKSIEDGFLMDYPVESFADLGISNKYLSFISSENVPLFGPDSLFAEDAIKDEEVVKSIVSKTIKKLTAEAISGKNYSDSLAIIGAFPKLKEIAMASLDTTIETLTANLDPDLTSDVDKEIALKLKRLGTARTHLRRNLSSQTTPQKVIVYNGGATAEAGLEQIRNIVTKEQDPQALTDIEKEFRTLIEVPIGQLGSYTSPIEGKSNWIKTLWSWFTGLKDPRWKREMERRESFMNGIRTEAESYIGQIERLVKEGWGGFTTEINTLLEQATGERNNLTISEEIDAALITERDAAKQEALNLEDPKEAFKVIAQADKDYELLVQKELNKVRQETRRRVNAALDKISEKSPELAETVRGLRYKITSSSRYVSEKLSEVDREDYKDIEARFSAQEGFYLTRTYRIFEDPSWSKFLYDKDDPRAKAIRLNAAREMFKKQQEDILSEQIVSLDKEAYKNNAVEWLSKSEAAKREEVGAIKSLDEVLKEKGMTEEDFLETVFESNFARYQEDQGPDILKRKKDVPKAIRVALGEIPDGTWNIIKTYEKVSYLANRIAIDANLERLGNPKNEEGEEIARPDQKWLLTEEEVNELGLDNYEPIDPALKANEGDRYSPLLGKGYFASPEMIESIKETRAFTPEPSTLGEKIRAKIDKGVRKTIGLSLGVKTLTSSTYYVRNVVGNTTYFALSLGLPPGTGMSKILSFREGKVKGELARAVLNPKEVDEYINKLVKDGVIEREFSVAVYEDMLQGTINEESLEKETFEILDKIQKENGLETIEVDSDKSLLETLKHAAKKGLKVSKKLENRLQKLSLASDSFYKIAVYEYELSTLKKARKYDEESGVDTGFRGKSDRELELMAIDKLKKTAQYFSQNMPGTEGFSRSFAGALVAPYYRFRVEVGRIMVNNSRLAYNEIKSENPIIKKRGYQRAAGAATVGAISTTATFAAEAALLLFAYGLGHRPADLTDEEKEALQLSVPPYLKTHTFLYTIKDGKYHSWDLTYLNPYSAYLDSVPTFQRALKRGESISSALVESSHVLFTAPFLEGQIATKAFYNALNNKNSKDEAIYFEHDDVGTKAAKSIASVLKEAYGAPTYMRLSENIKGMMSDDPTYTMGKLLKDELSPLKSYEIKPQTALYNFTRPMEQDKLAMRKALNKLATSKPVSDDELRSVIKGLKNSYGRLAKRYKDHSPSLLKIGATVNDIKKNGEELFTKEGYKNLMQLNAVPALFFSDRMKEVLKNSSNPEVRARLAKAAGILLEETNNGFIPLD